MTPYETASLWVQGITGAAILATFWIYYFQLRSMRQASKGQNLLSVTSYLQQSEVRSARTHAITVLKDKEYSKWSEDDRQHASLVCSTYDVAAIFIKSGLYDKDLFLDTYGPSLSKCYKAVKPFCDDIRTPGKAGARYWDDFVSLAKAAMKLNRAEPVA
jgi:hypothetical protein